MLLKILSFLVLSSIKIDIGLCSGEHLIPEKTTDVYVKNDDFVRFKTAVLKELQEMKEEKHELREEIARLKTENTVKDKRIDELEQKLSSVKEQHKGVAKRIVPIYETIGFTAYLDHSVHNLTHDQPIVYNKVLLNDGNGYNVSSGMFTAPVSGVYLFSYSVGAKLLPNVHLSQYDVFTRLMVNGVHQLSSVAESTSTYDDEQGSTTAIIYVEEGTQVWTKHEFRGGNNLYSDNGERVTSFTGTLLYEKEIGSTSIIG